MAANGNVLGFDGTGRSGGWQIVFKVKKRLTWHAIFMGSAHEKGSVVAEPHRPHQALTPREAWG